jgi:ABC-2 type transport system permease protein
MFTTVLRWELRALRRDPAFWAALIFGVVALSFALFNGERWRSHLDGIGAAVAERDVAARIEARVLATRIDSQQQPAPFFERDPRNPLAYADNLMAHYAVLPATPLAAITIGQSDLLPSALPLAPARGPSLAGGSEPENPHRLLIGRFDAAFAIVFLLPLLIIALTYALLAGERERGTLALLLAQPLTLQALFTAKLLPRILLASGLLLSLVVLFGAIVPTSAWPRLALWLAVALAYAAFWFALSAAVAVRRGGAATHAVTLAAAWLALTLLVPAGVNLAVKTMAPVPSRVELILALRKATDEATAERSKLLGAFYEDHPELAPPGDATGGADFATLQLVTNQKVERDLTPALARFTDQLDRQQSLVERLQYLSPALLAQSALADAAGTGSARHAWFFKQAIAHHEELRAFFEPRALRKEKFAAWDEVPAFRFTEEPMGAVAARVAPAIGVLFFAALAFGLLSWLALRRATVVT